MPDNGLQPTPLAKLRARGESIIKLRGGRRARRAVYEPAEGAYIILNGEKRPVRRLTPSEETSRGLPIEWEEVAAQASGDRLTCGHAGRFDELVVHNVTAHLEMMDDAVATLVLTRGDQTAIVDLVAAGRVLGVNVQEWEFGDA